MTHSLLNQFRDKADRTYDSNSERRGAFVEGACYAAANFHGIQLGGFEALPVADPMPTYADIEHKVETVAASRGLSDRPMGRKAFKNGAKWVLETFNPRLGGTPVVKDFTFTLYNPIAIEVTSNGRFIATAAMGDSVSPRVTLLEFTIPKGSLWNLEDVLRRLNGVK